MCRMLHPWPAAQGAKYLLYELLGGGVVVEVVGIQLLTALVGFIRPIDIDSGPGTTTST